MAKDAQVQGDNTAVAFDDAWKDVRADEDIQFAPGEPESPVEPPAEPPQWWTDFLEWLGDLFSPIGDSLSGTWPIFRIIILVLLAAGFLVLLWVIFSPYLEEWRGRKQKQEEEWIPEQGAARQLLDEADALADNGQYEEAAHLLLFRSIEDIKKRRPDLLLPSSTSREIERLDSLPGRARNMFAVIAGHVERGIFAASPIGKDGWTDSRNAYGEFALSDSWRLDSRHQKAVAQK